VFPTVAVIPGPLEFHPQMDEVDEVIEAPVDHLADPANVRRETWHYGGRDIEVPFYDFDGHKIWGATAMVLAEFLSLLLQ
jgi:hypothetical protein